MALLGGVLLDFLVVGIDREILWAQGTIDTGSCNESHSDLGGEGAQYLTLRHIQPLDGDALDALFCQQVGDKGHLHVIRHHLHTFHLAYLAMGHEGVAEVGIVEALGVDHVDTVELLVGGEDGDAVRRIFHA